MSEDKSQRKQRQQLIKEMNETNLQHYEGCLWKLMMSHDSDLSKEVVSSIPISFVWEGYPNLSKVLSALALAVRYQILKENNFWIKDDSTCVTFVEGLRKPFYDISSIKETPPAWIN